MPNFNALMDPSQIGAGIQNAFMMGREAAREGALQKAFGAYAQDPSQQGAQQVAMHDPRLGMALMDREGERVAAEREQAQRDATMMAKLVGHARDEGSYQQALGVARQMGWDIGGAPGTFAEAQQSGWLNQMGMVAKVMLDQGPEAFSTAGKVALDNGLQPGTPEFQNFVLQYTQAQMAKPYTGNQGETRLYQPDFGGQSGGVMGGIPDEAIMELRQNPGTASQFDEVFGQGASARILGGPQATPAGGF